MCLLQQGSRLNVSLEGRYSEVGQSDVPSLERQQQMLGRLSLLLLLLPPLVLVLALVPLPLHHHPCYHLPLFWGGGRCSLTRENQSCNGNVLVSVVDTCLICEFGCDDFWF